MRSSELQKRIDKIPALKITQLMAFNESGRVNELINGYLHEHRIKNGIDYYKVYKNGVKIEQGVNK